MAEGMVTLRRLLRRLHQIDSSLTGYIALTGEHHRHRTPAFWLASIGAHLGDSLLWAGLTALLWQRADHRRRRQLGGWIASLVATLLLTLGIKHLFKRQRPGSGQFLYGQGADVHSFPSGHGARCGVILVWAATLHPLLGKWAPLLVLWIGWSRVAIGIHYVGDVLVGLLLGLGLGKMVENCWPAFDQER